MREFICFYLLSMYSILVKSIYNIQNSRPRYSAIHQYFDNLEFLFVDAPNKLDFLIFYFILIFFIFELFMVLHNFWHTAFQFIHYT